MLLPISSMAKLWLWVLFFGLAKSTQYMALIVLGMEGWRRVKRRFSKDKNREISPK
jgi:phosphoglycolate phosphatase